MNSDPTLDITIYEINSRITLFQWKQTWAKKVHEVEIGELKSMICSTVIFLKAKYEKHSLIEL